MSFYSEVTLELTDLKRVFPEVYHGVADIYVYFYAQGLRQLRDGGALVYISSNKFMRAGYGRTLRRLLGREVTLRTAIDFGDLPVFEATTYPTVLVVRKRAPAEGHAVQALTVHDMAVVHRLVDAVREGAWAQPQASLRPEGWTLVRPEVLALVEKLRCSGTPLGEYVGGNFYRGIVTGLNKAFVIDQATRDWLVAQDPRSTEIVKPWLRGRDLKRWKIEWSGLYLIYVPWELEIEHYPAIYNHLKQHESKLSHRPEVRDGRFPWYALSRYAAQYAKEFDRPKIIYPHFNIAPNFAYDDKGALSNDKTYIIPDASLCLLGVLNTRAIDFFLRQICPSVQQGYMEFRTIYIEQIPVPTLTDSQRATIEPLVRKLLDAKGQGRQVAEWERELNALVYQAYGLTEEEIAIIEQR
jgi:adenine-specific DNA-methyltransferase